MKRRSGTNLKKKLLVTTLTSLMLAGVTLASDIDMDGKKNFWKNIKSTFKGSFKSKKNALIEDKLTLLSNTSINTVENKNNTDLDVCVVKTYEEKKEEINSKKNEVIVNEIKIISEEERLIDENLFNETKIKANNKDEKAILSLGLLYLQGRGVEQDFKEAVDWLYTSATLGNSDAIKELEKLAQDLKNPEIQNTLGYFYQSGEVVKKDLEKAIKYYKLSADQNNKIAQYNLGNLYERGREVKEDLNLAIKYYMLSANQGFDQPQKRLNDIFSGYLKTSTNSVLESKSIESKLIKMSECITSLRNRHNGERKKSMGNSQDFLFKNEKNIVLYEKLLSFEDTCSFLLKFIKTNISVNDGFMITCLEPSKKTNESLNYKGNENPEFIRYYPFLKAFCFGEENVKHGDLIYQVITEQFNEGYLNFSRFRHDLKEFLEINNKSIINSESEISEAQNKISIINKSSSDLDKKIQENASKINLKIKKKDINILNSEEVRKCIHSISLLSLAIKLQQIEIDTVEQDLETVTMLEDSLLRVILETAPSRNKLFLEKNLWVK